MLRQSRRGFALIDLVTVAAVMALFAALAVFGVEQARIRARSVTCRNNLRNIGVGLAHYHDTYHLLPTVTFAGPDHQLAHNPLALLVPLMDLPASQSGGSRVSHPLATYDASQPWFRQREGIAAAVVPTFRCPTSMHLDPAQSLAAERTHCPLGTLLATSDYIVSKGPNDSFCLDHDFSAIPLAERGAFELGRPIRDKDITDGLASTMVVGEGTAGKKWQLSRTDRFPLTFTDPQTKKPLPALNFWCWPFLNTLAEQRRTQVVATSIFGTTAVTLSEQPVIETILNTDKLSNCKPHLKGGFHTVSGFRSDHEKGAFFLFADGAARFVSGEILPEVYRSLSTIAGSEGVQFIN